MPKSSIVEEVAKTVRLAAKVPPEKAIGPESLLVEDLGIDSLDLVGVVLQVQDAFGVEIGDEELAQVKTVGDLAACVAERAPVAA